MSILLQLRALAAEWRTANPYRRVQIDGEIARLRAIYAKGGAR